MTRFEDNKKFLKNKDIGQFKSLEDLEAYLNNEDNYNDATARQKLRDTQKARHNADIATEAEHVFSGEGWDIYIPKTYAASCKLGSGTSWCTATTESDYYYNNYTNQGPLYILINKSNPEEKYQFHFESKQFMDRDDYSINLFDFLAGYSAMYDFFRDIMVKSLDIDYRNLDEDNYTFELTFDQLANYFENSYNDYAYRESVSGQFIANMLRGDFFEHFDGVYYDTATSDLDNIDWSNINNSVWAEFERLGYSKESIENMDDWYEVDTEITDAIAIACAEAQAMGAADEAYKDIISEIENSAMLDINKISTGFEFSISIDDVLHYAFDDSYSWEESGYGLVHDIIIAWFEDFKVYEPQYGWYGFSDDAFNEDLLYRLGEIDEADLVQ